MEPVIILILIVAVFYFLRLKREASENKAIESKTECLEQEVVSGIEELDSGSEISKHD